MKKINDLITEKLALNADSKLKTDYNAKPLKDLIKELLEKIDKKQITAGDFVNRLRKEVNNIDFRIIKGTLYKGEVEYNGVRVKVECSGFWWDDQNHNRNGNGLVWYMTHAAYPQGYSVGYLINDDVKDYTDPSLRYLWVDKKGVVHETEKDWKENATEYIYDNPISKYGIPWSKADREASIIEFIKRWIDLQKR